MNDLHLLNMLRRDDPAGLRAVMEQYAPYVATVIANQLVSAPREDVEELTENVFLSLWQHRSELRTDHLRGWLASAGRNEARQFLRRHRVETLSPEDVILVSDDCAQRLTEKHERGRLIRRALDAMGEPDREIFLRYYYYNQTVGEIAAETSIHAEAVKSRLRRGRDKLRNILEKGGYLHEA